MIKSMTGYGRAQLESEEYEASAEVKTLNSKFLDINIRLPRFFSNHEVEVRNLLTEKLKRGKVSLNVDFSGKANLQAGAMINQEVFKAYYQLYKGLKDELGDNTTDIFRMAAQAPDVLQNNTQAVMDESLWEQVKHMIVSALEHCDTFREQEGRALSGDLSANIESIRQWLGKTKEQVPERDAKMRERLKNQFEDLAVEIADKNRFEQELIYYIEKLDVNEEIVRLTNHLDYFQEAMQEPDSNGKKLGFISQEIGREINTIGSKANDAVIQRYVVSMKEELEKIKEQVLNVI